MDAVSRVGKITARNRRVEEDVLNIFWDVANGYCKRFVDLTPRSA